MEELFRKLENESLLLMYLAGELPEQERLELESMLKTDGGLRTQLGEVRSAWEISDNTVARLDSVEPLGSKDHAVRQVGKAMRQWQVDRMAQPTETPVTPRRLRMAIYSGVIAASIVLGFCIWWGFHPDTTNYSSTQPVVASEPDKIASNAPDSSAQQPDGAQAPNTGPGASGGGFNGGGAFNGTASNGGFYGGGGPMRRPFTLVSLDAASQRLADLEQVVSEDLQ